MDYKDYKSGMSQDHFWLQGKTELIEILFNKLNLEKNSKILDIGSGTGQDLQIINKFGNAYVVDIEQKSLDMIPIDLVSEKKLSDACNLDYPDNYFDIVVTFDVLEHIKNDKKAVQEIYRVLKPNGKFIFTVPAFNFLYSNHDKNLGHFRRYNKQKLKMLLTNSFYFQDLNYWLFFLFLPASVQRLLNLNFVNSGKKFPKLTNKFFVKILNFENWLIKHGLKFPMGLSIYGICKVKK
ncbi:class I SAM-dependent methyltransferase [Candidatus Babeliales bacterium]|nr:class I SAM-dependent methyltransferase [Candidatus Babeliales bacterium]